jgi:hypothetical protein
LDTHHLFIQVSHKPADIVDPVAPFFGILGNHIQLGFGHFHATQISIDYGAWLVKFCPSGNHFID